MSLLLRVQPVAVSVSHIAFNTFAAGATTLRGLILKLGIIQECSVADEGLYPAIRISGGYIVAGGAGTPLVLDAGRMRQAAIGEVVSV